MSKKISVKVVTLGCAKNTVDSEKLVALLAESGLDAAHLIDGESYADVVLVNTCGFINDAKQESIETVLDFIEAKKEGLVKKLIVFGCLSERYREELIAEMPEVDGFFGVKDFKEIASVLAPLANLSDDSNRVLSTPKHYAYLKIAEGCNHRCSFCAIPNIRGKFQSTDMAALIDEGQKLVANGVKELIVIAQDTTYYGYDLNKRRSLSVLLDNLSNIKGLEWLRLQYAYPYQFPMDILDVIASKPNICNYIDIPFQHINDRLLTSMQRKIDRKGTLDLISKIRAKVPNIALRTSLIVGYPGETKKEYNELVDFVKEIEFDRLGVFTYSHEESTAAYKLKDNIKNAEKQARYNELMEVQRAISMRKNENFLGTTMRVLIDRMENDTYVGRTEFDSPEVDNEVLIKKKAGIKIGNFYNVKITGAFEYDLEGVIS